MVNERRRESQPKPRPVKETPVCRYYGVSPNGCFSGDQCRFLHIEPDMTSSGADRTATGVHSSERISSAVALSPYEQNKTCRYFEAGFCKNGIHCWYRHVARSSTESSGDANTDPGPSTVHGKDSGDEPQTCAICFETPVQFGLLGGCSHIFCLDCIRNWRVSKHKDESMVDSGNTKKCPMCRAPSRFITPSSRFFPSGDPRKQEVTNKFLESCKKIPCKYFEKSKPNNRFCPYGHDCFYQHQNDDGTPFVFRYGIERMMDTYKRRCEHARWSATRHRSGPLSLLEDLEHQMLAFADQLLNSGGAESFPTFEIQEGNEALLAELVYQLERAGEIVSGLPGESSEPAEAQDTTAQEPPRSDEEGQQTSHLDWNTPLQMALSGAIDGLPGVYLQLNQDENEAAQEWGYADYDGWEDEVDDDEEADDEVELVLEPQPPLPATPSVQRHPVPASASASVSHVQEEENPPIGPSLSNEIEQVSRGKLVLSPFSRRPIQDIPAFVPASQLLAHRAVEAEAPRTGPSAESSHERERSSHSKVQ